MVVIHPTALIAPGAELGEGTEVGPYSIIGPHVRLGRANKVASHVVIEGHTTIGDGNTFFQFSSIGSAPQDKKFRGEPSTVAIGDRNTFREYVTVQPGTEGGGMSTTIGNDNLLMVSSHVAHDSHVGNGVVVANSVALAGHVRVGDGAILGGLSAIHQFVNVGRLAFVGGGAMVAKDIPPFMMAQGDRAYLVGVNTVGLHRAGVTSEDIGRVQQAYRIMFRGAGLLKARLEDVRAKECGTTPLVEELAVFVERSERGVARARRDDTASRDE